MNAFSNLQELELLLRDPKFFTLFILLMIWTVVWKGFALWKSVKNDHKIWFIVLLVINTAGILEILYIFLFSQKKEVKPII
jgi:hypothetical protein